MQQNINAILAVSLVVLVAFWLALLTGFWPAIIPLLQSPSGPAGLSEDFSLSIFSTALGTLVQVLVTFLIVQFIVNRRERLNRLLARRRLADGIAEIYQSVASKIAGLKGVLPGSTSDRSIKKTHRLNQLIWRFDRAVDEAEEEQVRQLDELYDLIVFEHEGYHLTEFERTLEQTFKMLCPDPFSAQVARYFNRKRRPPHWQLLKQKVLIALREFIERRRIPTAQNQISNAAVGAPVTDMAPNTLEAAE